jgi:hypothetical protein
MDSKSTANGLDHSFSVASRKRDCDSAYVRIAEAGRDDRTGADGRSGDGPNAVSFHAQRAQYGWRKQQQPYRICQVIGNSEEGIGEMGLHVANSPVKLQCKCR